MRTFSPKCTILRQGEVGGTFYIILQGQVNVYTTGPDGVEEFMQKRGPGYCFGEETLFTEYTKYITSVSSDTYCVFFTITHADFHKYLKNVHNDVVASWTSIYKSAVAKHLQNSYIISHLTNAPYLSQLGSLTTTCVFATDDTIYLRDEEDRAMYLILKGEISLMGLDEEGNEVVISVHRAGEWIGEDIMLLELPRLTTARVTSTSVGGDAAAVISQLTHNTLLNFLSNVPETRESFLKIQRKRLLECVLGCGVPFFSAIPSDRFEDLVSSARVLKFDADEIIIKEGDAAKEFFILAHGSADILVKDRLVSNIKAGKYFGEIGLVADIPRTATVRAHDKTVVCFAFSREIFSHFFEGQPEAYAEFAIKISRENVPIAPMLVHDLSRSYLLRFCQLEHSVENLEFYLAVESYRKRVEDDPTLKNEAQNIWSEFIEPGKAPNEVNLKANNVGVIRQKIDNGEFTPTMYDDAQQEIVYLMNDTLQRYKKTDEFKELLNKLGKYEAAPVVKIDKGTGQHEEEHLTISIGHHKTVVKKKGGNDGTNSMSDETVTRSSHIIDESATLTTINENKHKYNDANLYDDLYQNQNSESDNQTYDNNQNQNQGQGYDLEGVQHGSTTWENANAQPKHEPNDMLSASAAYLKATDDISDDSDEDEDDNNE